MLTTDDLSALDRQIQNNEAWRPYLYDDATGKRITQGSTVIGHPTLGYGFNLDKQDLPQEVGDLWFDTIRTRVVNEVFNALPWTQTLGIGPLRAVIDLAYNSGVGGLLGFHKMLDALSRGDLVTAKLEMLNSTIAPGRRQRLAALLEPRRRVRIAFGKRTQVTRKRRIGAAKRLRLNSSMVSPERSCSLTLRERDPRHGSRLPLNWDSRCRRPGGALSAASATKLPHSTAQAVAQERLRPFRATLPRCVSTTRVRIRQVASGPGPWTDKAATQPERSGVWTLQAASTR